MAFRIYWHCTVLAVSSPNSVTDWELYFPVTA